MKKLYLVLGIYIGLVTAVIGQNNNPFNIYHQEDTIGSEIAIEVQQEDQSKLNIDNPFTISHIPIRKNQYQQIEQLDIRSETEKENIAISYAPLWLIALSLCLLAYMLFVRKSHILALFRSLSNDNFLKLTQYEQNGGRSIVYFVGYVLLLINFSLFLYLTIQNVFDLKTYNLWSIFLMVTVFFIGKHIVLAAVSWIFEFQKEARLYEFTIITIRNILALVFLVLNILFVFGPSIWSKSLASIGAFFFIIFLISRYYKGLKLGRRYLNSNVFHFFLYFCAFELSPWVIVYKLAGG